MPQTAEVTGVEEAKAESQTSETSKSKKGFKMNLIIILVVQVILAGGYFVVSKFVKSDPSLKADGQEQKADEKAEAAKKEAAEKHIYSIEDIIVNPAGTGGSRYLSVSVGVEMAIAEEAKSGGEGHGEREAKATPLDAKKPQLRDALINILSSKSIDQLTNPEQKEMIRNEILGSFKSILSPKEVYQIYFIDFVLQ